MPTRISVTLSTAWTTDPEADPFPEADHYPDFVLTSLQKDHPDASIEVTEGFESSVTVDGERNSDLTEAVKVDLWEDFCTSGFRDYTHLVALGA
jgi:hypothetical protein